MDYQQKTISLSVATAFLMVTWFLLRTHQLGMDSLWYDEAYTWWRLKSSWGEMINILLRDVVDPPAYFILSKPITDIFGTSPFSLRILSVIFNAIGINFVYKIGQIAGGKPGGIAAFWVWVFHPMVIWFSRDAKPYSLTLLLSIIAFYLFLSERGQPRPKNRIFLLITLAIGILSHYFFFIFAMGLVLFSLFEIKHHRRFFRRFTLLFLGSTIPLWLWLAWMFSRPEILMGSGWISPVSLLQTLFTFWNLLSGYAGALEIPTLFFGILLLIALFFSIRHPPAGISPIKIILFTVFFPILGVWIVSLRRPIFVDRYFIVLLAPIIFLASHGFSQIWKKTSKSSSRSLLQFSLVLIMILIGSLSGWNTLSSITYQKENWKALTAHISANHVSDQPTVWFSDKSTIIPFGYYYKSEFTPLLDESPPICEQTCWWAIRQPFTSTHAFTQSINPTHRPWLPELPPACTALEKIDYRTGIQLWKVVCDEF